jgi:hypothetical protein
MPEAQRTFGEDLAENNAEGNWYRPIMGGPDYCVLDIRKEIDYMLVDIGGTDRSLAVHMSLRDTRLNYNKAFTPQI